MAQKKDKIEHLVYETYIASIQNSVGSKMFRQYFVRVGSKKIDALRDGDLACAFYVSSLLRIFDLIDETHTFVSNTEKDMLKSGWFHVKPTGKLRVGAILVWGPKTFKKSRETHKHIGFYIGHQKAISNNSKGGMPYVHKYDFRPIESVYWHQSFPSEI